MVIENLDDRSVCDIISSLRRLIMVYQDYRLSGGIAQKLRDFRMETVEDKLCLRVEISCASRNVGGIADRVFESRIADSRTDRIGIGAYL